MSRTSRWVKMPMRDAVEDSEHVYPPVDAMEVWREKRRTSGAISLHWPGAGASWPWDEWLTEYARKRPLRCRPWKIAR